MLDALQAQKGLACRDLGGGRIHVGRTYRPTWALVAAIVTAPIVGLGLLFLLVKQTEAGEIRVVEGPRGTVITLPVMLPSAVGDSIEAALATAATSAPVWNPAPATVPMAPSAPRPTPVPAPTGAYPTADLVMPISPPVVAPDPATLVSASHAPTVGAPDDGLEGRTVPHRREGQFRADRSHQCAVVRFGDGEQVQIEAGESVVLGRDPSPRPGARTVPVPHRTVSKSHLLLSFDGREVVAEDLHSTNGSRFVDDHGTHDLPAGVAMPVPDRSRVVVGDLPFELVIGP